MLSIFPTEADLPEGFQTPIIAFEFAKVESDLRYMTGNSPAAVANRQKMDAGMQWDMFFPIAYAALLGFLLLDLAFRGHLIAWPGFAAAVFIFPFDIYENLTLLEITSALNSSAATDALLEQLQLATWLKWGTIAVTMALLSSALFQDRQKAFSILAGVTALGIAVCWLSGSNPRVAEIMSGLSAVFFLVFSLKAVLMPWREQKTVSVKGAQR